MFSNAYVLHLVLCLCVMIFSQRSPISTLLDMVPYACVWQCSPRALEDNPGVTVTGSVFEKRVHAQRATESFCSHRPKPKSHAKELSLGSTESSRRQIKASVGRTEAQMYSHERIVQQLQFLAVLPVSKFLHASNQGSRGFSIESS